MPNILIYGASSGIAQKVAENFAKKKYEIVLLAKNTERLDTIAKDLHTRFSCKVTFYKSDALDYSSHLIELKKIAEKHDVENVLIAHGTLPDQKDIEYNFEQIKHHTEVNYLSVVSITIPFLEFFEKKGRGTLAVISSVAGDRGRASNAIYGSAKAALTSYLSGLRQKYAPTKIKIITIKPGLVYTAMTAHLPQSPLTAKSDNVGKDIFKAILAGKEVLYTPSFWKLIMFVVRHLPESIFKKLKF